MSLEKGRNSFILKKIKKIFFTWNIIFFKLVNLRKNKIKITKIKLHNNTFIFFFNDINKLNYLFNLNVDLWENKMNVLSINYNGFYLNYFIVKKWKFSKNIFEKVYINFFIKLMCSLIIKLLLNLILKSMFYIRYNYINYLLVSNV